MRRKSATVTLLAAILLTSTAAWAGKVKTGKADANVFTDARYGFTFEKNDNWKFKIPKEKPDRPSVYRFELQKSIYQLPHERRFAAETWTIAYGGFFIDTTSLNLEQFKSLLIKENRKHKQKKQLAEVAEIIRDGTCVGEKRYTLGNLGVGCQLTYKEEYDAQIKDYRGVYNIITDHLMGDLYFTVDAGKVSGFFFTAERTDYRICKAEIERMLATLKFPGREKKDSPAAAVKDSMSEKDTLSGQVPTAEKDSTRVTQKKE